MMCINAKGVNSIFAHLPVRCACANKLPVRRRLLRAIWPGGAWLLLIGLFILPVFGCTREAPIDFGPPLPPPQPPPPPPVDRARLEELRARIAQLRAEHCTGGQLRLGMSHEGAIRAWCYPDRRNTTETPGHLSEQWVYRGKGYLYFDNGRLTGIQRTE
jgi:hypothetical protein